MGSRSFERRSREGRAKWLLQRSRLMTRAVRLLWQRDGLEREGAGILSFVVADNVGQLAFSNPTDVADLRHRDWLDEAILDGLDIGFVALDRHFVEFAIAFDQQEGVAE